MLVRFLANAAAIALATWLMPGIALSGPSIESKALTLLAVAVIFGLANSLIKPIFTFVTAPLLLITLGLFLLVVNAALLLLVSWVCGQLGLGWNVDGFWTAFWGALIVSIVSFLLNAVFTDKGKDHK